MRKRDLCCQCGTLIRAGDNDASNDFFRGLRAITKELDRYLIVDEVQTGGGPCGTFWAHEQWDLPTPPDVVTFSKKIQAAGFYHNMDLRPAESYRCDAVDACIRLRLLLMMSMAL